METNKEQLEKELKSLEKEKEKMLESIIYHKYKIEDEEFYCQAILERINHIQAVLTNK